MTRAVLAAYLGGTIVRSDRAYTGTVTVSDLPDPDPSA
jgi:hypothetical protein